MDVRTKCDICIHRNVCSLKDDYLNTVESLHDMFYNKQKNKKEFMIWRDPDCKFYQTEISMTKNA